VGFHNARFFRKVKSLHLLKSFHFWEEGEMRSNQPSWEGSVYGVGNADGGSLTRFQGVSCFYWDSENIGHHHEAITWQE
jgi:hypothetical protein